MPYACTYCWRKIRLHTKKAVSGLLSVQSAVLYVCIVILQDKGEWRSFLTDVTKQAAAVWQKCVERAPFPRKYDVTMLLCSTSLWMGTTQHSMEFLRGSTTRFNKPWYAQTCKMPALYNVVEWRIGFKRSWKFCQGPWEEKITLVGAGALRG